jgi:oligopeptide transport system ATP-binding protein
MDKQLLAIRNLRVNFRTEAGLAPIIDDISLGIDPGEILGIVGESGCGKSVTSLSIMGLIPEPPGEIVGGEILFRSENLLKKNERQMRAIRGNEISMIFQEPMTSLNPVYSCGGQIAEALRAHGDLGRKEAWERAIEMLSLVGIPLPGQRAHEYPHQLSGGMRQRIMIAMALSCQPKLLIADEPTTALDATIQAQILELMKSLQQKMKMAIMLITHDLGVIAEMADRVAVMYAGKIVEEADVVSLFRHPLHPYTEGLLKSVPRLDGDGGRLHSIEGTVPDPLNMPSGCRFNPRCPAAGDKCYQQEPALVAVRGKRKLACWRQAEVKKGGDDSWVQPRISWNL